MCVGRRWNCWADLGIKQKILCVSRCRNCWDVLIKRQQEIWISRYHNCWVVLIKRQQETWSHNFWVVFIVKQKETCCMCFWIQNTWVHLHCHSCWDVSQFCSQSSGDSFEVEGQGVVTSPKINKCCNCWDIKLLKTWSCDYQGCHLGQKAAWEQGQYSGLGQIIARKWIRSFFLISEDSCKSLLDCSIAFPSHFAFLLSLFRKCLHCCIVNRMLFPMYDQ